MVNYAERKERNYCLQIGDKVLVLLNLHNASNIRTIKAKDKLVTKFLHTLVLSRKSLPIIDIFLKELIEKKFHTKGPIMIEITLFFI
jgi:hypothetical protein